MIAFPTSPRTRSPRAAGWVVAEHDQSRVVRASLSDRRERAHPELDDLFAAEPLGAQVGEAERLRMFGERRRRQLVRWQVDEVPGRRHASRDERLPLRDRPDRLVAVEHERELGRVFVAALANPGVVGAERGPLDDRAHVVVGGGLPRDGAALPAQRSRDRSRGGAEAVRAPALELPDANLARVPDDLSRRERPVDAGRDVCFGRPTGGDLDLHRERDAIRGPGGPLFEPIHAAYVSPTERDYGQ